MSEVRVAVLGASGWMGKIHTMAYQTFPHFFGVSDGTARIVALVDSNPDQAEDISNRAPGARIYQDWKLAVADPEVDLIDICLPDHLHYPVAKAALLAGKHVYCEKPLANTADEARELAEIARERGVITRVGHAFPRNPVHDLAKDIIESGEIGEIKLFRGCQHVDMYGDPTAPFMWRADGKLAPTGIVGDTGSHIFSFMDFLVGRVSSLIADNLIVTPRRPVVEGLAYGEEVKLTGSEEWADITNPDATNLLCRFANGAGGIVDFSRVATGRKFMQTYEVYGTKGSIAYTYDEINRLRFYSNDDRTGRRGFREIDVGPENATFRAFLPLPNFGIGYNESKIIEAAEVIRSIVANRPMWPTFDTGHHICQIVDACMESSRLKRWVDIPLG
ncbi:Gfo/Idh/MocA family oxidoreductase [Rhizobium hidalgonense]|uniref:Oxidoreductase n=1 Tax=Rhizobium hidalgonense TaxID=1538159 RepID=A0A2A6KCV7_9HYPH|nr:Gfo/Idh/MocA family oxidoreductase [Rhizobium hidalgonense]MDR9777493.1 Gfo/Idh/MocA family oxidoreductase [Rhizobium hidalgonense]MDR9809654.1 Gfo/Idh/MocA family oxidoreductase [Rhizobium hidalgonense]MDR9823819.1 Gfo/Idh/MocA family oxidoreductase [Rhizobium hidalgonense]PDT22242.1 oxidoreductase [Rhizobium hidalgonense]PON08906.1 oxidoreductase [Rhizobium hidalgonense]